MFQDVISEFRNFYADKQLTYEDFTNIIDQYGKLDVRCLLEEQIKKQLYDFIIDKQDGVVTYSTVETLVFEFLLQQDVPSMKPNNLTKQIGRQAKRLPDDMLKLMTNEFLIQFKNFYKLIENRYGIDVEFSELENLGEELQRKIKINSVELLRYVQPLVDQKGKVKISELLELCNDLERIILDNHTIQQPKSTTQNSNNNLQNFNKNQHFSSDDESKSINHQISVNIDKKDYPNIIYQQTDIILQKRYVNLQGKQHISEINLAVQKMEAQILTLLEQIKEKDKKIETFSTENSKKQEQFLIEIELAKSQLQQFEFEIGTKDQQIEILLQDNDFFQEQMNRYQEQCTSLNKQIQEQHDQLSSITQIETELKQTLIDNKKLNEIIQKNQTEINRLTQNNKSLMKIIEEFENKQNDEQDQVQIVVKDQNKEMINHYEEKLNELQQQYQQLEQINTNLEKQQASYEAQIIELKREISHYKKLYENLNCENQQLRNSIMPRQSSVFKQFNSAGLGRMSKLSIPFQSSNLKVGRIGSITNARMSSISRICPQITHTNFNPLEDLQNRGLKISELDEPDQQDIDQQYPDQQNHRVLCQRINPKYEQSVIELIQEEPDEKNNEQIKPNDQEQSNQLISNFDKFWMGLKNKNQQESIFDPTQIQIDENILYQRDFLGIRDEQKIKEYVRLENNVHRSIIQRCFSDSIYRIDAKGKRARRIIFLTEYTFYVFYGENKPGKLSRNFAIKDIKDIIFSEDSPVICCIKVAESDDYLIETFKRTELNIYLTEIFTSQKIMLYNLEFLQEFKIKFKGVNEEIYLSQVSKKKGYLDQGKISTYKVSTKSGWLQLMKSNFLLQESWKELFAVLTNVGLILFKKPGEFQPQLFVSLVDAIVIKDPLLETNKQNLFKIRYESSEYEYIFSTTSSLLQEEWLDIIQSTIMEQLRQQQNKSLDLTERSRTISKK